MTDHIHDEAAEDTSVTAVDTPEVSDDAWADASEPQHTLLRVWSEVLSNLDAIRAEGVPMALAGRIVSQWPQISFQETPIFHDMYHDLLLKFRDELDAVIAENPGASEVSAEEDLEHNYKHYKRLVIEWNILLDQAELQWEATSEHSHVMYAAIVDARQFLFSRNGFAGHLEQIGFTLDVEEIQQAILEAREGA